ncbi:MAG: ATP-binding protein [Patescibacteria group bacterium]|jgi:hypothetical protein
MAIIEVNERGIKQILRKYTAEEAFAEFIWNGFDAGATDVRIDVDVEGLGGIRSLSISDNGSGIDKSLLDQKFRPFFQSEKMAKSPSRNKSLTHGRNGIGRLTFFTFSERAVWTTRFKNKDEVFEYDITIESQKLNHYETNSSTPKKSAEKNTGTTVTFDSVNSLTFTMFQDKVEAYLKAEFGWFLELNKKRGFAVLINGKPLDYASIIGEQASTKFIYPASNTEFEINFVRWSRQLHDEYSRYYLVNSKDDEIWKETTKLNNKGDSFYHSVYIKSDYFDEFNAEGGSGEEDRTLFGHSKSDAEFKFLEKELTQFLRKKRKPFLANYAKQLIEEYESKGIIPKFGTDQWDLVKKNELEEVIKGLYQVQPKIFSTSSIEEKKTLVGLLNVLLESGEKEKIFEILKAVLELDSEDIDELCELLKVTHLSNIIHATRLIKERFIALDQLNDLVFKTSFNANERDHLQKFLDLNYWIFGEQYHLLASTEQKFEKALANYHEHLGGEIETISIKHRDKNKEMDLFLCRQNKTISTIENIVVELKRPSVILGEEELSQVKKYMSVILSVADFNASNMHWEFILVGNRMDSYIEDEIENNKNHGEKNKGLVFNKGNYKIYVRTWSEVLTAAKLRHQFIQDKLQIDQNLIAKDFASPEEIVTEASVNLV